MVYESSCSKACAQVSQINLGPAVCCVTSRGSTRLLSLPFHTCVWRVLRRAKSHTLQSTGLHQHRDVHRFLSVPTCERLREGDEQNVEYL